MNFNNREEYIGEWLNGKMNGKGIFHQHIGKLKTPNGDEYNGDWIDNEKNGYGILFA